MKTILIPLALLASAAVATPAIAQTAPKFSVRYADLNLASAHDAQIMLHRINEAATEVCRSPAGDAGREAVRFDDCHKTTVAQAVAQLGAPMVTAAYEGNRSSSRAFARNP